jgi:tetratricopeptide (TPR) repeat protein
MKIRAFIFLLAGTLFFSTATLMACLWDSDTLASESARFPEIPALITGTFPRHSQEFYEWRRKTCEQQLAKNQALFALYDDLAVAQHKLGDHKGAIATMLAKEKLRPGIYETYSNLGTFYIYTGELEQALDWIRQALAINPDAHFGREKYQKWLVEWVLERSKNPGINDAEFNFQTLSLNPLIGFAKFVAQKDSNSAVNNRSAELALNPKQLAAAMRGVTGMMRFADFNNPLLQEALGDLLLSGDIKDNAAQLASLCYLHAATTTKDPAEKKRLMAVFAFSGRLTSGFENAHYDKTLKNALSKGDAYFQSIRKDEMAWIAAGLDASAEFQKKYLAAR